MEHGGDVEGSVRSGCGGADGTVEVGGEEEILFSSGCKDEEVTSTAANENFAVGDERRSPEITFGFMRPTSRSGAGIDAMHHTSAIRDEHESVLNRRTREAVFHKRIGPDLRGAGTRRRARP